MSETQSKLREQLEKQYAALVIDHATASEQYNGELNEVSRNRLQRQMDRLQTELNDTDKRLKDIESSNGDSNRKHLDLDGKLPKIDFQEIKKILEKIFGEQVKNAGAALFLFQRSNALGGKWGVRRMRDLLEEAAGHFSHYPVGITPEDRGDERSILDRLADHAKMNDRPEDLKKYAQNVISAIRESLQGGSVVFIEVNGWHFINPQERVLKWFLDDFWVPLAQKMPDITQKHRKVKIVNILITNNKIPPECMDHLCVAEPFDCQKVVELPLRKWTQVEIADWLDSYYPSLNAEQVDKLAEQLFESSEEGNPVLVYNELQGHFC